jgi:hypothetical protein
MGDVVNLRRERKRKARGVGAAKAAENRLKFGASKGERELQDARRELAERALDGARLVPRDDE